MIVHLIFALITLIGLVLIIILCGCDLETNFTECLSAVLIIGGLIGGLYSGLICHNNYHYRYLHEPSIEDVNNGYAELYPTIITTTLDNVIVQQDTNYIAKWSGTNTRYEHFTNDVKETYYYKHNKIK